MRLLQALLVDIDGTLVDSNDQHADCWIESFKHFGRDVSWEEIRPQIGKGGDLLVPDTLDARSMRSFGEELKRYRSELWKRSYIDGIRPFPGAAEALGRFREEGIRIALASSSNPDEVSHYARLLGVEDLIDAATSRDDARLSKPSPEIFAAAMENLGADPARTAAIGDTPWDILAAHRLAIPVVAVLSGGFPRESLAKAEVLCEDIRAVTKEIDRIDDCLRD